MAAEAALVRQPPAEGGTDGQAMNHDLRLLEAHAARQAGRELGRHEALVHPPVEPRVVTRRQVRHHRREGRVAPASLPAPPRNSSLLLGPCFSYPYVLCIQLVWV